MDWRGRLTESWEDRGLLPRIPPASDADVQAFERRYSICMPPQIRSYFQLWNGMNSQPGKDLDENGFRFMPLSELRNLSPQWAGKLIERLSIRYQRLSSLTTYNGAVHTLLKADQKATGQSTF